MILGTHNSFTSYPLVWWQRPISYILNLTSRCQNKNINEQLLDGVRLFNIQICKYRGQWRISHGLCIYDLELFSVLDTLKLFSGKDKIIIQLYLDKNFFVGQDEKGFYDLVGIIKTKYCSPNFILQIAQIEGTSKYPHRTSYQLSVEEHYWSKSWAKNKKGIHKLPLPKYHAKKFNKNYIDGCKSDYLMLDYYNEKCRPS